MTLVRFQRLEGGIQPAASIKAGIAYGSTTAATSSNADAGIPFSSA